jgi:trigger factor
MQSLDSLRVERPTATVSAADVDEMLESMRRQKPVFAPVTRPAQETDRVTVDYEGRIDGEVFAGGKGEGLKVVLGARSILQELDTALRGMAVGESKLVQARFPDDYGAKSVAGKQAQFDIKVSAVEAQSLPELDEAFVRSFGFEAGGVAEFRANAQVHGGEIAEAARVSA